MVSARCPRRVGVEKQWTLAMRLPGHYRLAASEPPPDYCGTSAVALVIWSECGGGQELP